MISTSEPYPKLIDSIKGSTLVKDVYCYACHVREKWKEHIEKTEHKLRANYFLQNFIDSNRKTVTCKICIQTVHKEDVNSHAIQHKLIPWYRPKNEFINYFQNFIGFFDDLYWCYLCEKKFEYWFLAVLHINENDHKRSMSDVQNDIDTTLPSKFYKNCVLHSIFPKSIRELECLICDCCVPGYQFIKEHIAGAKHGKLRAALIPKNENPSSGIEKNVTSQFEKRAHEFIQCFKNFIGLFTNDYWCYRCAKHFNNYQEVTSHIQDIKHQSVVGIDDKNINTSLSSNFYKNCISHGIFPKSIKEVKCLICNHTVPGYKNAGEHITGKTHRNLRTALGLSRNHLFPTIKTYLTLHCSRPVDEFLQCFKNFIGPFENGYWCYVCKKQYNSWQKIISHIQNTEHQFAVGATDKNIDESFSEFYENFVNHGIFPRSINTLECFFCNCILMGYQRAKEHISGVQHREKRAVLKLSNDESLYKINDLTTPADIFLQCFKNFVGLFDNFYWCYTCKKQYNHWQEVYSHFQYAEHQSAVNIADIKINLSLSSRCCKNLVRHSIFQVSKSLQCFVCNCALGAYLNARQHITAKNHKKKHSNFIKLRNDLLSATKISNLNPTNTVISADCRTSDNAEGYDFNNDTSEMQSSKSKTSNSVKTMPNDQRIEECNSNNNNGLNDSNKKDKIFKSQRKSVTNEFNIALFSSSSKRLTNEVLDIHCGETCLKENIVVDKYGETNENRIFADSALKHEKKITSVTQHISLQHSKESQSMKLLNTLSQKNNNLTSKSSNLQLEERFLNNSHNCDDYNKEHELSEFWKKNITDDYQRTVFYYSVSKALTYKMPNAHGEKMNLTEKKVINKNNTTNENEILDASFSKQAGEKNNSKLTSLPLKSLKEFEKEKLSNLTTKNNNSMSRVTNSPYIKEVKEYNSNNNNDCNNHSREDKIFESWEQIVNDDHKIKFFDSKLGTLKNEVLDAYNIETFSKKNVVANENDKTNEDLIYAGSSSNQEQNKNNSASQLTNSLPKISKKSKKEKSLYSNAKTPKKKKNRNKDDNRLDKLTRVTISRLPKHILCNVCKEEFKLPDELHAHSTKHFWPRFVQENKVNKTVIVPSVQNKENCSNTVINLDSLRKKSEKEVAQPPKPSTNDNSRRNVQLSPKFRNPKYLLQAADILDKPRKVDIYQIDSVQFKMMNLSASRCYILDNKNIYCLICREEVSSSSFKLCEHLRDIKHNNYMIEMIQDHMKFLPSSNELSDLSLARELIEDVSDKYVHCYACTTDIKNNLTSIKQHLKGNQHMEYRALMALNLEEFFSTAFRTIQRNWYNVQRYWCVLCRKHFVQENVFYHHLYSSKEHVEECGKFSQHSKFVFDYCSTCSILFYGFQESFAYHCQIKKHKYFSDKQFYIVNKLPLETEEMLTKPDFTINQIIQSLNLKANKTEEEEKMIIEDLESIVSNFMEIKAYLFGSRACGLATDSSDLDIFLDCDNRYYTGKKSDDILPLLKTVVKSLEYCDEIWKIERTIEDCSVPIIRATHVTSGIQCDISFPNGLTTECTRLINTINRKFPVCRKLILFIKQWINKCNLNGEKKIHNYAVTWMLIFYLQTKSLLPSITELIKSSGESKIIGGWEAGVNEDFELPESNCTFENLLKGFFKMFADYDFRNFIICPLLGKPIPKKWFNNPKQCLPGEMETYKQYCNQKNHEPFRIDSPLCIQDPFDLSNNITKAIKKLTLLKFKTFCDLTAVKLEKNSISNVV